MPLIVVVGDRHDEHSVYAASTAPRERAVSLLGAGTILSCLCRKSFRAPTFNDLYYNDGLYSGNPKLRPETAKSMKPASRAVRQWERCESDRF